MATSGNDHRPLGLRASRHSPAHASIWSPRWTRRRWRDHRFFTSALITMAVIATVSGATVAARPTSEAIAASGGSFGSVASDPSGASDPSLPPSMNPLTSPTSPFPTSPGRSLVTFPNQTIGPAVGTTDPATVSVLAAGGIPATALDAYRRGAGAACAPPPQPSLRNHLAAARRYRTGGVESRAICWRDLAQRRPVHSADHWHPAGRVPQRRCPRHRRRAPRRRPHLRPRGRPDAVHPIDVGGLPRRRQRRRPVRPVQHL
jgi:hypothetical protein